MGSLMKILVWVQAIGMVFGLLSILVATKYRTAEHPVWYRAALVSPYGWKKNWWTQTGYWFQRVGTLLLFIGLIAGTIYWGRYCFMDC